MDEEKGVVSPETTVQQTGAVVSEGLAAQQAEPQFDVKAELEKFRKEFEQEKIIRKGVEKGISKTSAENQYLKQVVNKIDVLEKRIGLDQRRQTGTIDDITYQSEIKRIEDDQSKVAVQSQKYQEAQEALANISESLAETGIDPNSDDPKVVGIRQTFESGRIATAVRMAEKLARETEVSKLKTAQPDIAKLEEDIRRKILEEQKRGIVTDKGIPGGASNSKLDILRRFNEGDRSVRKDVGKLLRL